MRVTSIIVVLLLAASQPMLACACTSGDGGCSASTNCGGGGCFAICGSGGCTSGCTGGGGGPLPKSGLKVPTFSYTGEGLSAAALQDMIGQELKVRFVFVPKKLDDQFSVELHDVSAADLKAGLAKLGAAAVIERRDEGLAEKAAALRFSLKAENAESETVASLLRAIFGEEVTVKAGDPASLVSLDLEDVTLRDLRIVLPKFSGIRVVAPEALDHSNR